MLKDYMHFYVLSSVLKCSLRFRFQTMFGSSLPTGVCRSAHVFFMLFVHGGVQYVLNI